MDPLLNVQSIIDQYKNSQSMLTQVCYAVWVTEYRTQKYSKLLFDCIYQKESV